MDIIPAHAKAGRRGRGFANVPRRRPQPSFPLPRLRKYGALLSFLLLLALSALPAAPPAAAQGFAGLDDVDATGMSYHRFVRPGEATVEVLMLGNTGASGVYVVGMDTGLPEFLALSGVTFGASSRGEKAQVTVRIFRQQGAQRELIFEAPVEEVLTVPANIPAFQNGDIIYLESISRTRFDWFQVIRTVSSIASLIYVTQRLISGRR